MQRLSRKLSRFASPRSALVAEGVAVSMGIQQLIYDADRLHDAASLIHRLTRT
jgi:hypothetical protein